MKPWYQSKKLWSAIASLIVAGLSVSSVDPARVDAVLMLVASIGGALQIALGLADYGKEAEAIRVAGEVFADVSDALEEADLDAELEEE